MHRTGGKVIFVTEGSHTISFGKMRNLNPGELKLLSLFPVDLSISRDINGNFV